jgi:hypothetical protein
VPAIGVRMTWLLASVIALASSGANAQPRGRQAPDQARNVADSDGRANAAKRLATLNEMDAWLRRLVGQYRYDGVAVQTAGKNAGHILDSVEGRGVCVGFGVGPGASCMINAGLFPLNPAMLLYGIDPDELGIRYLQADDKGIVQSSLGFLKADTVTFKRPCMNWQAANPTCEQIIRFRATPRRTLEMWIDVVFDHNYDLSISYVFYMRNLSQDQAREVPGISQTVK